MARLIALCIECMDQFYYDPMDYSADEEPNICDECFKIKNVLPDFEYEQHSDADPGL